MMDSNESRAMRDGTNASSGNNGPNAALIAFVVIAALFVVFFLQNGEQTQIDFLVIEWDTTIRWSLIIAVVVGVVLDRLVGFWWRRRRRRAD